MKKPLWKKWIGSPAFYRLVLTLALPLLVQNAVTNFVNLLDNLMVGQVGTEEMSGVSIVNQILFVYNLVLFGGVSGAGIFAAQFHGRGDEQGVRDCLRFNLLVVTGFTLLAFGVLQLWGEKLIGTFLHDAGDGGDLAATLHYGRSYLRVMVWGLLPFAFTNAYTSVLRVTGDTQLPMKASVAALGLNLGFNWLLIFGKCGFPVLGVQGAAIATVIARYVEAAIIVSVTHAKSRRGFARGVYRSFVIPAQLTKNILVKGMPLMANELFWSLGQTMLVQSYSLRGLTAVAALNINSVVLNLFNVVIFAMGNCVAIILGNSLGAGEFDRAREQCPQLIFLSAAASAVVAVGVFLVAPFVPRLYNTTPEVMVLASSLMRVCGVFLPVHACVNATYFTLRGGGRTYITVVFDSVYSWLLPVPAAWLLMHLTGLPLLPVYLIINGLDLLKMAVGLSLVHRGVWVRNIIEKV